MRCKSFDKFNDGTLTITKAYQNLVWNQNLDDVTILQEIELLAKADSKQKIEYSVSDDKIAVIEEVGSKAYLKCIGVGEVTVSAIQNGNDNYYQTMVTSFTKGTNYELTLSRDVINENDHVLIIDDFLANGEAVTGAVRLLRMAHATVAGVGVLIEKAFQPGREKLTDAGFEVYALASISSISKDSIIFE